MRLDDLCASIDALDFPSAGVREHPDKETVLAARAAATDAVVDDEFVADCISREVDLLESAAPRRSLVPFLTLPRLGVGLAFGYHPPGGAPGAHEHTAWTITAVCRNALDVATFDREASYRRRELVPKNVFRAVAGQVGFIYEPCIHEPRNTSSRWSLSFHVMSPRDGEPPGDALGPPPPGLDVRWAAGQRTAEHPYGAVLAARQRQIFVGELLRAVAGSTGSRVDDVRERCLRLASSRLRRLFAPDAAGAAPPATWVLTRTHAEVAIDCVRRGDGASLYAGTADGPARELTVNGVAGAALATVARETTVVVRDLPGGMSEHERASLAEALEDSGLFTRSVG